jgi:hypothetical protein
MRVVQLLLLVCSLQLIFSAPTPPQLSESFTADLQLTVSDKDGKHVGTGVWGNDQPNGKGVENYKFDDGTFDVFNLQRYDLKKAYSLTNPNTSNSKCQEFGVSGTMPLVWSWVTLAKFVSTDGSVDVWESLIGYANLTLGVKTSDPTTPVYLVRASRDERESRYDFTSWSATAPVSTYFTVPSTCSSSSNVNKPAACISRADIIARAKVWVANKVPYNQGATYQGYREDCSGYVSMCWDSSQPGHVTSTIPQIAKPISKGELQPGDCLLYAAEHVVLFGGWTDSSQSEYQAYEETKPGEGTVTRPTPYPYWYSQSDFLPYRYNDVCA